MTLGNGLNGDMSGTGRYKLMVSQWDEKDNAGTKDGSSHARRTSRTGRELVVGSLPGAVLRNLGI